MAIAYTGTFEIFIAGEGAPPALDALFCDRIIVHSDDQGSAALQCIKTNPLDPDSVVEIDTSIEPPVLRLRGALAVVISGRMNPETDEFIADVSIPNRSRRVVSSDYSGPGSLLDIL